MNFPALKSGDVMLYRPNSIYGKIIAVKTWHNVAHCEGYAGNNFSVAARDGKGVGMYTTRIADLAYVLRPRVPFDVVGAARYFATVDGQKYDWYGLMRFVMWGESSTSENNKKFCSEFLTSWQRGGQVPVFNGEAPDAVAPFQFLLDPVYERLYESAPK